MRIRLQNGSFPSVALVIMVMAMPAKRIAVADDPDSQAAQYFEANVRPVLAESCWKCHGPENQKGGLRLDSRAAMVEGGESGPAIEPGKPDESLLIAAIRQGGDAPKMPPKGKGAKLSDTAIAALSQWIKQGAPWPASAAVAGTQEETAREHWSFQPVRQTEPPTVPGASSQPDNPIDAFVRARLGASKLAPSQPAAPRTLIRRLTFDLIGLPPTAGEIDDFLQAYQSNPKAAVSATVDRLLASPRYGERWGRHWLDVARYADTKGYVFTEERRYPFAYTYRDWVVAAFNRDMPFNEFVIAQLAADQMPPGEGGPSNLPALGFLTVGRRFLNVQEDIIDDRIDATTRGFLGLTVSCARCHDHKYDPIPAEDYYSLYGVFASCEEPKELPAIPGAVAPAARADYERQLHEREAELTASANKKLDALEGKLRSKVAAYLLAAFDLNFQNGPAQVGTRARADGLSRGGLRMQLEHWSEYLKTTKAGHDPIFEPWHRLQALPAASFTASFADVMKEYNAENGGKSAHPLIVKALAAEPPPANFRDVVARYAALFQEAETRWQERLKTGPAQALDEPDWEALRQVLYSPNGPMAFGAAERPGPDRPISEEMIRLFDQGDRNDLTRLRNKITELNATHPGVAPRAMVVADKANLYQPYVFLRGNAGRRGPEVPRRFLKLLAGPDRKPFEHGSGRLDLARAIADPANPLTARVLVNRVWLHHFGEGLVRTPSDFGVRSDPPSHPELLDWMAARFIAENWSIKFLHRVILTSQTYQQRSDDRADGLKIDPQNALLWKQNRRRLEFEPLRDAMLAVAGRLDATLGGRPVEISATPYPTRRTLYAFIDRQNLDGLFRTFDFASPDASAALRFETTVPQQALFLMNHPFVAEQARRLAARTATADPKARIQQLYVDLLGRPAEPRELAAGERFIEGRSTGDIPKDRLGPWEQYAQVLLLTNEFAFID